MSLISMRVAFFQSLFLHEFVYVFFLSPSIERKKQTQNGKIIEESKKFRERKKASWRKIDAACGCNEILNMFRYLFVVSVSACVVNAICSRHKINGTCKHRLYFCNGINNKNCSSIIQTLSTRQRKFNVFLCLAAGE